MVVDLLMDFIGWRPHRSCAGAHFLVLVDLLMDYIVSVPGPMATHTPRHCKFLKAVCIHVVA